MASRIGLSLKLPGTDPMKGGQNAMIITACFCFTPCKPCGANDEE
jgi:hypothetical protein